MAEINTSIYQNQPNPLQSLTNMFGIANTAQQLQLGQQAQQIRQFELQQKQNDAVNALIGPLKTVPGLDANGAKNIILPQMRAMGLDPASSPVAAQHLGPLLRGELDDPKKFQQWLSGHAAPFLGAGGFTPTEAPTTPEGVPQKELPLERAARTGAPTPTGIGPAQEAAARAAGAVAGGSLENARIISANLNTSTYGLKQAIENLERLGIQGSGPTTRELTALKSFLISTGAYKVLPGVTPEMINQVTDYQVANKYLNDWARASGDTHTVSHLEAAQESNPNMSLAQQTNLKVARTGLALARMKFMQQQEFESARDTKGNPYPEAKFNSWVANNWNVRHDPAVFLMDQMSVKKRSEYLKSLSDKRPGANAMSPREQFLFDLGRAEQLGVVQK